MRPTVAILFALLATGCDRSPTHSTAFFQVDPAYNRSSLPPDLRAAAEMRAAGIQVGGNPNYNYCAMQAVAVSASASGGPLYQSVLEAQLRNACLQAN